MTQIENGTLTTIPGIKVGHWTDHVAMTGCTVITLPEPNVIAGEARGAAPASRETALLAAGNSVEQGQAFVLSGGSAFGLAAADGVMTALEADDRGYPTPGGVVPIVPAASLFDLAVGDASVRPTAAHGELAYRAAASDPVEQGLVGAGTGATVSKWRGVANPGGLGSAAVSVGDATVAALVALNALGDAFSLSGESLTGGPHVPSPPVTPPPIGQNTTLAVVATDAALTRAELGRLCVRAHDAFGACIRPAHTAFDGDTCFAVSVGIKEEPSHAIAEGAFAAIGFAIEAAILASRSPRSVQEGS